MSGVDETIALVAKQFIGMKAEGQPALARILEDTPSPEQLQVANFPLLAIEQSSDDEHRWKSEAVGNPGLVRHDYTLKIFLFVGAPGLGTPIPALHTRALAWELPFAEAMFANLTLTAGVTFIGEGSGAFLLRYRIGGIRWNNADLYGLVHTLPVTEKHRMTVG